MGTIMQFNHKLILSLAIAALVCAGFAVWQKSALAQGMYRSALMDFGLPSLTPEVILQFEEAGIPQEGLQKTDLRIFHQDPNGNQVVSNFVVEKATRPREFQVGLMLRPYLSADRGMIFLFDVESEQSFWMRNTLIPLDIIYIDSKFNIVSIANGTPLDPTPLPSNGPAQYVLELNAGTAARLGFGPGDRVAWD